MIMNRERKTKQFMLSNQCCLVKQVRTPPVRPADGVVGGVYESFVPGEDYRGLGLRAKIKSAEHAPAL